MYRFPTLDRSKLDALTVQAHEALRVRDAIDSPCSQEWRDAHSLASAACIAVQTERRRLWRMERWGQWMSRHDRELATITGEL